MELCWRGSSTGNSRKRNKRILLSQEKDMNEDYHKKCGLAKDRIFYAYTLEDSSEKAQKSD